MTANPRASGSQGEAGGRGPLPYLGILIGVLSVSSSSILFQFSAADPLVIGFYRLGFATLLLGLPLLFRGAERPHIGRRNFVLSAISGVFLAFHFGFWFFSLRLTSIAASTVLVCTHPFVLLALNYFIYGERTRGRALLGVLTAVAGAAAVGWGDFRVDSRALVGDGFALAGAVAVSGYFLIGSRVRQTLDAISYSVIAYGTAALLLGMTALLKGAPLAGYPIRDWLVFLGMAIFPTVLGHTLFNWALRHVPAAVVSVTILGEPVGATFLAWLIWRTVPAAATLLGGLLILAGTTLFLLGERQPGRDESIPAAQSDAT